MADEVHIHEQPPEPRGDVHVHQHPPAEPRGDGGGPAWLFAVVAAALLVILFWFVFARGNGGPVVPEQIDVDINLPDAPAPTQPPPAPPPQPPAEPAPSPTPPPGGEPGATDAGGRAAMRYVA